MKRKLFLSVILTGIVLSCSDHASTDSNKPVLNSFTYSSFRWRIMPENEYEVEFFIEFYLTTNNKGEYQSRYQNPRTRKIIYSKGLLPRPLLQELDNSLSNPKDTIYQDTTQELYNGNWYHLDYSKNGEYDILLNQDEFPPELHGIFKSLDSICKFNTEVAEPFDLEEYRKTIQNKSKVFGTLNPPEVLKKPPSINTDKFEKAPN